MTDDDIRVMQTIGMLIERSKEHETRYATDDVREMALRTTRDYSDGKISAREAILGVRDYARSVGILIGEDIG